MGLFSGLKKAVKNIFKGVKKLVKSKAFQMVLLAASIYFTYGAISGAAAAGSAGGAGATLAAPAGGTAGATAGGASGLGAAGASALPSTTATINAIGAGTAGAAPAVGAGTVLAPTAASAAQGAGLSQAVGANSVLAPTATGAPAAAAPIAQGAAPAVGAVSGDAFMPGMLQQPTAGGGFLSKAGAFIEKNPMASYGAMQVGGGLISSAFTPNQADEQLRYDAESRRRNRIAGYGSGEGPVRVGNRTYGA